MLVLAALVLLVAAMAGGYVIRLATATSATPTTVVTSTDRGGSSGAGFGTGCIYVQDHRGC
ncbi:MAG TPA: hypothetical protein VF155_06360 [Candidatus Dormibacteraeota bacterium]